MLNSGHIQLHTYLFVFRSYAWFSCARNIPPRGTPMGMSDEEFISEKIRRTTVQRDFRPVGIHEYNADPQIEFSPLDAIAFPHLPLSQALIAENHSHASVTLLVLVERRVAGFAYLVRVPAWEWRAGQGVTRATVVPLRSQHVRLRGGSLGQKPRALADEHR